MVTEGNLLIQESNSNTQNTVTVQSPKTADNFSIIGHQINKGATSAASLTPKLQPIEDIE